MESKQMRLNPFPPEPVRSAVMLQNWEQLTFLHWRYDPRDLQRFLPRPLEIDTLNGEAWVGLTPFVVRNLRPPRLPSVPWLSSFPETNVRTYVRGPNGYPGIWFFSLDAARLPAVVAARAAYGLPYMWAHMRVTSRGGNICYISRRRWPSGAASDIAVAPGEPFSPQDLGERDHFLTARFRLYTNYGNRLACARVEHAPWPLARASVLSLSQTLLTAVGLGPPQGEPLLHYSPGVSVRVGALRFL